MSRQDNAAPFIQVSHGHILDHGVVPNVIKIGRFIVQEHEWSLVVLPSVLLFDILSASRVNTAKNCGQSKFSRISQFFLHTLRAIVKWTRNAESGEKPPREKNVPEDTKTSL